MKFIWFLLYIINFDIKLYIFSKNTEHCVNYVNRKTTIYNMHAVKTFKTIYIKIITKTIKTKMVTYSTF